MGISNATRLADFGSGIGTEGAVIAIDQTNERVGIGTTKPNSTLTAGAVGASGTTLHVHGDGRITGVLTATAFYGDGANLTGISTAAVPGISTQGASNFNTINATGVVTASSFVGSGADLTGVSGFATALGSDGPLKFVFKTPKDLPIAAGTSIAVESDQTSGAIAFMREWSITIGSGSTVRIGSGTTLVMNVLSIF